MKKIILIILFIIFIAGLSGGGVWYWQKNIWDKEKAQLTNELYNLKTQKSMTNSSWQTYINQKDLKFTISYPNDWVAENQTDGRIWIISKKSKEESLKNIEVCNRVMSGQKIGDETCAPEFMYDGFSINIYKNDENLSLDKWVDKNIQNIVAKEYITSPPSLSGAMKVNMASFGEGITINFMKDNYIFQIDKEYVLSDDLFN